MGRNARIFGALWAVFLVSLNGQEPAAIGTRDVFYHLTRTIAWYQHLLAVDGGADKAEGLMLRNNAREFGKRTMQTSFAFARAEAAVLGGSQPAKILETAGGTGHSLAQSAIRSAARVNHLEERLVRLDVRIASAGGPKREALTAERMAIAADLGLARQMQAAVKNMTSFGAASMAGSRSLQEQINDLESVNPTTEPAGENPKGQSANAMAANSFHAENSGVLTLISQAVAFARARKAVDAVRDETDRLLKGVNRMRDPLRTEMRAIVAESDRLSNKEDSAVQAPEWLAASRQISELTARFKQLSSVTLPLSETVVSIQAARGALDDWRGALDGEYKSTIRYLAIRLGAVAGAVLLIFLGSAIWQRATFRYVVEPRRRRQLLLVKRVVVGFSLALLLALGFFSGFTSMATLLGFVTAGLALALQNVVLSAVAYFFLVGKYGLKVGDRVTVQGVTGQVIEVGLIRLFLMELTGTGTEMHSTGRLAVFANSVIFQPTALMKQAPGMDYAWHAATVVVEDPPNYQDARERLAKAVNAVYEHYRQKIEQQHKTFERSTDTQSNAPVPVSRAQFTQAGLEIAIRYPVSIEDNARIDEQIVDGLIEEAAREPKLRFTPGGSPKVAEIS